MAGEQRVPFTTGILIGIGETRRERIEALLALRELHEALRPYSGNHHSEFPPEARHAAWRTRRAPSVDEHLWTIAVARLIFPPSMNIQAPPNLSPGALRPADRGRHQRLGRRVAGDAGSRQSRKRRGRTCRCWSARPGRPASACTSGWRSIRLMPSIIDNGSIPSCTRALLQRIDADGWPRTDDWSPGTAQPLPEESRSLPAPAVISNDDCRRSSIGRRPAGRCRNLKSCVCSRRATTSLSLSAAAADIAAARGLRRHGLLCRHPQHQLHQHLLVQMPVLRVLERQNERELARAALTISRSRKLPGARAKPGQRGATEVCMQGGIHPDFTGAHLSGDLPRRARRGAGYACSRLFAA